MDLPLPGTLVKAMRNKGRCEIAKVAVDSVPFMRFAKGSIQAVPFGKGCLPDAVQAVSAGGFLAGARWRHRSRIRSQVSAKSSRSSRGQR